MKQLTWLVVLAAGIWACGDTGGGGDDGGGDDGPDPGKVVCGDNRCDASENQTSCPADCKPQVTCGDKKCEGNEASTCPADCGGAVCGNNVCEVGETSTCPTDCPSSLKAQNNSSYTVYTLYVAKCGQSGWGVDQTGSGYISPGSSFTLNGIPPGCYYFRAETSGAAQYWQTASSVTLQPSSTFTWTLNN